MTILNALKCVKADPLLWEVSGPLSILLDLKRLLSSFFRYQSLCFNSHLLNYITLQHSRLTKNKKLP